MRPVASAVAVGAADENVAEELHLKLFKTGATATFTLALGRVETECARVEAALLRQLGLGKHLADIIESPDIDCRIGARGFAENGLVHQHDACEQGGRRWFKRCAGAATPFFIIAFIILFWLKPVRCF